MARPSKAPNGIIDSMQVGASLVVLNLSQQTDSADLLGGFRPVQPAEAFRPLLARFAPLFAATFSKGSNEAFLARTSKFSQRGKWQSLLQAFKSALAKVKFPRHQSWKEWENAPQNIYPSVCPSSGASSQRACLCMMPGILAGHVYK